MKTKFKYQWNSFFDYLGAFDSSFNGKQRLFYQSIRNDPKNKDEKYFTHTWAGEKEKTRKRISRYTRLINLRRISLPLIIVAILIATICYFLQSWLAFSIIGMSVFFLIAYWMLSYGFTADRDICIIYLQWMNKSEVQGKITEIIEEAFDSDLQTVNATIVDLPEITQSEFTALIAVLVLSDNLNLSTTEKDFLKRISSQITISGKEINPTSFYKSYSRFKNDSILVKSAYNSLMDKLKNIDLDTI